jgi:hypothetical protein
VSGLPSTRVELTCRLGKCTTRSKVWVRDYDTCLFQLNLIRWIYALIVSIDANFKQKARARPGDARDPTLGPGYGCFVPHRRYIEEVASQTKQDEVLFICHVSISAHCCQNCRLAIVLVSPPFGMRTRRNRRDCEQQELARLYVHGMDCFGQTEWVIYRKARGESLRAEYLIIIEKTLKPS